MTTAIEVVQRRSAGGQDMEITVHASEGVAITLEAHLDNGRVSRLRDLVEPDVPAFFLVRDVRWIEVRANSPAGGWPKKQPFDFKWSDATGLAVSLYERANMVKAFAGNRR